MEKLFTYKEFVDMMQKYGIRHTKRKLRRGENLMENASKFSNVVLLINGYISSYTYESPEKLLSIFEPGIFLRYSILEDQPEFVTNIDLSQITVKYTNIKKKILNMH